jgi:hypothetical protein
MTMARTIPRSLAAIIENLELDGDVIVTTDRLSGLASTGKSTVDPHKLAYSLQEAGWLGSLRTRGAWEFIPASRAGRFSSGDRFLEFRAQRAVNPEWPGVLAMESAAVLLSLATRLPGQECFVLPPDFPVPKAFSRRWRAISLALPASAITSVQGLPVLGLEGLLAAIAARPSNYRDAAGLGSWLSDATDAVDLDIALVILETLPLAAVQRFAYLLGAGGNNKARALVVHRYPPRGVSWFGPREQGGVFDPISQVSDTTLSRYLSVGTGA